MPSASPTAREIKIAEVLRPLGEGALSHAMAERAGKLLGVHWTSVYRGVPLFFMQ
jgi:putative transposase